MSRPSRAREVLARSFGLLLLGYLAWAFVVWSSPRRATLLPVRVESDLDAYVARKQDESRRAGVWAGCDERLVRPNAAATGSATGEPSAGASASGRPKAPVAILYMHGFGACRAEGEDAIDPLAASIGAPVYYVRLPGHATNLDDHAARSFTEYLQTAEEGLEVARGLGDKVIVAGSSTGGLLAAWLAARHPAHVDALILASPLFGFRRAEVHVAGLPGGPELVQLALGSVRDAGFGADPEHRKVEGYDAHWLVRQRLSSIGIVDALWRLAARRETYAAIHVPVLLLHYYRDADHQDETADVGAMRSAFDALGALAPLANGQDPRTARRWVPIADGNHILTSRYVRVDREAVQAALRSFVLALGFVRP